MFALQARSPSPGISSFSPQDIPSPASSPASGNTNTSGIDEQAVASKVEPGLVDITATLRYSGQVFEGTGMVLSQSGLVLTNNHVIDGSTGLTATVVSTGRRYTAQIVGTDATDDIALLKLDRGVGAEDRPGRRLVQGHPGRAGGGAGQRGRRGAGPRPSPAGRSPR